MPRLSGFMSSLLVLLLCQGYADQGDLWASWQGFPHSSSFFGQVQRKMEEKDGATTRTGPEILTSGIWMWSRWDLDTHPSLTLSCYALLTLHLDIFVYSFENTLALMDRELKYIDKYFLETFWLFSQEERWDEKEEFKSLTNSYPAKCREWLVILALECFLGVYTWGLINSCQYSNIFPSRVRSNLLFDLNTLSQSQVQPWNPSQSSTSR